MFTIVTQQPIVLLVLSLLLGFLYACFLYNNYNIKSPFLYKALFLFRFLSISIISFFLLEPFLSQLIVQKEKPIIVVCVDQSESMQVDPELELLEPALEKLINELNIDYDVKNYALGSQVYDLDTFYYDYSLTNYEAFFQYLSDVYSRRNLAAVVFCSDGLYNTGSNPLYSDYPFTAPLYIIALGDTTVKKDVRILKVYNNDLAFLGNTFPLEITFEADFCSGEKIELAVYNRDEKLHTEYFHVNKDNQLFTSEIHVQAKETGVSRYRIVLSDVSDEDNTYNNYTDIFVEVLESKQKILLLSENTHPDIFAISAAINQNNNYELEHYFVNDFHGDYSKYSLLISFHTEAISSELPNWRIYGVNTMNQESSWLKFNRYAKEFSEVDLELGDFSYFKIDKEWKDWTHKLPPLLVPFGSIEYLDIHQNLFLQIENGVLTDRPIFSFYQGSTNRDAITFGEGFWKWRLFEYVNNQSHNLFDNLIQKSVQFLVLNEDKRNFRVEVPKKIYEHEIIKISAELYNLNYELVTDPDISITLTDHNDDKFEYIFNKDKNGYFLDIKHLKPGLYKYSSQVSLNGEEDVRAGEMMIIPLQLEINQKKADHHFLYTLSQQNYGDLFYLRNLDLLIKTINNLENKTISYSYIKFSELLNKKWIFFLLLLLLSLEWFLRKRNGNI